MKTNNRSNSNLTSAASLPSGFTLVEIMVVVAILGLLVTMGLPNWLRARTVSQRNSCINNIRQLDGAKQLWALETGAAVTAQPDPVDVQPYLGRGQAGALPLCPAGRDTTFETSYLLNPLNLPPECQIVPEHIILPE